MELPNQLLKNSNNDQVLPLLVNIPRSYPERISSVPPRKISTNCKFVVDLNLLDHPEDVMCDALGAWRQTETSKKMYTVHKNVQGHVTSTSVCKNVEAEHILVTRRPFLNKSDESLHKVVVSLSGKNHLCNMIIVKYDFKGPCQTEACVDRVT